MSNDMINFYTLKDVQKLMPSYDNPNEKYCHIKHPFRMGIIASSGGGKTSFILNLISKMDNTFGHIYVVHKMDEPLYEFLEKKIPKQINFYKKIGDLPPLDKLPKDKQILIIFDDLVNDKNQDIITEFFIRARKHARGISLAYLSQSYFKIPKTIRLQFSYLIILKLSSLRDLNLIMSDFNLGVSKDTMMKIYKDATKEQFNFLKIDFNVRNDNRRYSHNFCDYYILESDSDSD